jgi:hypothetical protein
VARADSRDRIFLRANNAERVAISQYRLSELLFDCWSPARRLQHRSIYIWIQREKDHFGTKKSDQPLVTFVPLTPFSALFVWALTYWPALTAKHIWIIVNLVLLSAAVFLLHSLTSLEWRRIAL